MAKNKCGLLLDKITKTNPFKDEKQHEENFKRAGEFIDCLDKSSFIKIRKREVASRLIIERLAKNQNKKDDVWNNLCTNTDSEKYFEKPEIDPSLPVLFVDTYFLSKRKGNVLGGGLGKTERVENILKTGGKFEDVPIYDVKSHQVEEGNHRVDAMKRRGVKCVPVSISGAWD